jgi:ABC-2 type transport system permease protein
MTGFEIGTRAWSILQVQWRTLRYYWPPKNWAGLILTSIMLLAWYGGITFLAIAAGVFAANPEKIDALQAALPRGLLTCFLYWQVMPLMTASMGLSLDLKKLLGYPISRRELFSLELLLRLSTGFEVLVVLLGTGIGLLLNPKIPAWAPLALVPFIAVNLFLSLGVRELLKSLLGRKYFRELAALLLVLIAALPQVLVTTGKGKWAVSLFAGGSAGYWPWSLTAVWVQGHLTPPGVLALAGWIMSAYFFAQWEFYRSLRFDTEEQNAGAVNPNRAAGLLENLFRFPGALVPDPLAILMEKELRLMARSSRFRLVFAMGFSFGLLIWLPLAFSAASDSFLSSTYLTIVSIYGLLLLSDVLFWNTLGFDRSAAQIYFLAPVKFSQVLISKNLTAIVFVVLEITLIVLICGILRLPLGASRVIEAYLVPLIVSVFLLAIGNLTSVHDPRPTDPAKSFRSSSGGRTRALLTFLFPLALAPAGLAYLARYAFNESNIAFYAVLVFVAIVGGVVYSISLDSAVLAIDQRKESLIAALSRGAGPVES